MNKRFREAILKETGASDLEETEEIQSLWSGYGKIARYRLLGADRKSVVAKQIRFPNKSDHPRGWNSDLSHQRKVRSYEVERAWYSKFSHDCDSRCRVPQCLAQEIDGEERLIALEDLSEAGFDERRNQISEVELGACLRWLANFHAQFLGRDPDGLWKKGTYWHLDTRPDELSVLEDEPLKASALAIDSLLESCRFKTLVHGDAKLANFCFAAGGERVAAVDFQYVGGGCGMKDVAYFVGSCLREEECDQFESKVLKIYFQELKTRLVPELGEVTFLELEKEWSSMYHVAWADFHRFLKGWSPGHWKLSDYSERVTREVVKSLIG